MPVLLRRVMGCNLPGEPRLFHMELFRSSRCPRFPLYHRAHVSVAVCLDGFRTNERQHVLPTSSLKRRHGGSHNLCRASLCCFHDCP